MVGLLGKIYKTTGREFELTIKRNNKWMVLEVRKEFCIGHHKAKCQWKSPDKEEWKMSQRQ